MVDSFLHGFLDNTYLLEAKEGIQNDGFDYIIPHVIIIPRPTWQLSQYSIDMVDQ